MAKTSVGRTRWHGDLKDGRGETSLDSGVAPAMAVSWTARTEGGQKATSPEELIAAAHSACFSMALSKALADKGHAPESLETTAVARFAKVNGGFGIESITLHVTGHVPGISAGEFAEIAEAAKNGCPVSQALVGNVKIEVEATLE